MKEIKDKKILVIANGLAPKSGLLNNLVNQADIIIAADGGSNICFKNNIMPDFIIGDLDSIDSDVKSYFRDVEIIHRPDQNETDLMKSLKFCESLNPKKVLATAVFGKRTDHAFSNLHTLQESDYNFEIEFYDDFGKTTIVKEKTNLNLPIGQTVSLISFAPVFGVSLKGFKYSLNNRDFPNGFNGISNIIQESPATISVKKGSLISYIPHADY